jgi:AcrR family transcriptional regulator
MLERAQVAVEVNGVEGLSLRQIARDIGVSHGAPSRHFRDKQALLDALALDGFATMNARLAEAAESEGSYRDRLLSIAHAYVDFAVQHPILLSIMHATRHHDDAGEPLLQAGREGMLLTVQVLRQAQESGIVRSGDPVELAFASFAAIHGVAVLATNGLLEGMPLATALSSTAELLWHGLTSIGGSPKP